MPKKYNINHKDICLFLETQFFIVEITANGGQPDVRVYPPCAEGPARKKPVRDNSMAIKRKRGIHLKKAHTLIHCAALCMALLTAVQVLPGNGTLNARAQDTVTVDAPGDGDAMHVMNLAGDGQLPRAIGAPGPRAHPGVHGALPLMPLPAPPPDPTAAPATYCVRRQRQVFRGVPLIQ